LSGKYQVDGGILQYTAPIMARVEQALIKSLGIGLDITGRLVQPFVQEVRPVLTYRAARAWGEREYKIRKKLTTVFVAPKKDVRFVNGQEERL
jgi:hypothetical protein